MFVSKPFQKKLSQSPSWVLSVYAAVTSYVDEKAKKNYKVPSTNTLTSALDKEVDSAVQPYIMMQATTGLSIGILKDGKTFFYGYGETAKGNKQIPNEHTIFEIGSISKTFTATLLADAVNSNKIKLDDSINKYCLIQFQTLSITELRLH